MKNLLFFFTFLVSLCFINTTQAQSYKSATGVRLGSPLSASYKTFIGESSAIEGIASFRGYSGYSWFSVSAAYQIHKPLKAGDVDGLNYYFGPGAGVYFWNFSNDFIKGANTTFGIQGYLGLEYTFADLPVSISVDWIPTYLFNGYGSGFGAGYGSVGVRYILSK